MDLFTMNMENQLNKVAPLADKMRPDKLEDVLGQDEILSEGSLLYNLINSGNIRSIVLYGPPGTGKTSIARIIANITSMNFEELSAVTSGVKDIKNVIQKAEELLKIYNKRTILFIDEIHRFNKSQQDILLPYIEKGILILIGATTENPYFEVNKALLSRVMVIKLNKISSTDILSLLNRAIKDRNKGLGNYDLNVDSEVLEFISNTSEGDARYALNLLESLVLANKTKNSRKINLNINALNSLGLDKNITYDKSGEEHYNTASAFIKSMRGSDIQASLYWLAKMIHAGEDPIFIARRILIFSAEDIGLADPNALVIANAGFEAIKKIGMPESRIILSELVIYMAAAEKSNSSYTAIGKALKDIRDTPLIDVPDHLKDNHYIDFKNNKKISPYKYPHDYGGYVEQEYLPLKKKYYVPKDIGYEKKIASNISKLDKKG